MRALRGLALAAVAILCTGLGTAPSDDPRSSGHDLCAQSRTNPDKAIAACTRLIDLSLAQNPDLVRIYNDRGTAYVRKKDYKKALADFEAVLRLKPDDAYGHYNRGLVNYELDRYDGAIADFDWLLARDAGDIYALGYRGLAHMHSGSEAGALDDFNTVLRLAP